MKLRFQPFEEHLDLPARTTAAKKAKAAWSSFPKPFKRGRPAQTPLFSPVLPPFDVLPLRARLVLPHAV
jgi:hypothetical protein